MAENTFGPMGDPQFWGDMGRNAAGLYGSLKQMGTIPGQGVAIAGALCALGGGAAVM